MALPRYCSHMNTDSQMLVCTCSNNIIGIQYKQKCCLKLWQFIICVVLSSLPVAVFQDTVSPQSLVKLLSERQCEQKYSHERTIINIHQKSIRNKIARVYSF